MRPCASASPLQHDSLGGPRSAHRSGSYGEAAAYRLEWQIMCHLSSERRRRALKTTRHHAGGFGHRLIWGNTSPLSARTGACVIPTASPLPHGKCSIVQTHTHQSGATNLCHRCDPERLRESTGAREVASLTPTVAAAANVLEFGNVLFWRARRRRRLRPSTNLASWRVRLEFSARQRS